MPDSRVRAHCSRAVPARPTQPLVGPDLYAGDGLLMFWSHECRSRLADGSVAGEMRRSLRPNALSAHDREPVCGTEATFIDMSMVGRLCRSGADPRPLADRTALPMWVGVDASVKRDSTAMVAVTLGQEGATGCGWSWAPRVTGRHRTSRSTSRRRSRPRSSTCASRFGVRKVLFDPFQMRRAAQRLRASRLPMEEFPQPVRT